ncbi:hypothetical protein WA158_008003 [Blastocystis sp. Blastoise]
MYNLKPENAITRAQDYLKSSNTKAALQILFDILEAPRYKTWTQILEDLVTLFLDICVQTRDVDSAKEGLNQYRNICQTTNPASMHKVVLEFLDKGLERVQKAHIDSKQQIALLNDVDDVNAESILMSAATTENDDQRVEREVAVPWMKFYWECLRNILDALKNNKPLEGLYHSICRRAFDYCIEYHRTVEFKTLCRKNLKKHVDFIKSPYTGDMNIQNQKYRVTWTSQTAQLHLQTRFEQIKTAIALGLWSEVYNTLTDIRSIMSDFQDFLTVPALRAQYYEYLIQYFWNSHIYKYHAYCQMKSYDLYTKSNASLTEEKQKEMANSVLLSILSIPTYSMGEDQTCARYKDEREKESNISKLIGLNGIPSRAALIREFLLLNVLPLVNSEYKDLYTLLEEEFSPLDLVNQAIPILTSLSSSSYSQYVPILKRRVFLCILQQIEDIYSEYHLEDYYNIVSQLGFEKYEAEKYILEACRTNQLHLHINHIENKISFTQKNILSDQINVDFAIVHNKLNEVLKEIRHCTVSKEVEQEQLQAAMDKAELSCDSIHKAMMSRYKTMKNRKDAEEEEELEIKNKQRELRSREASELEERERQRLKNEEIKRAKEEIEKREREQLEKEKKDTVAILKSKYGRKVEYKDVASMTREELKRFMALEAAKSQDEKTKKYQDMAKHNDWEVRALRETAAPLIMKSMKENEENMKEYWKKKFNEQKEKYINGKLRLIELKPILDSVDPLISLYADNIAERRIAKIQSEVDIRYEEDKKRKEEEEKRRLEEEKKREEEEKRRLEEKRRIEEQRKIEEEERKRKAEEEEKAQQEAMSKYAGLAKKKTLNRKKPSLSSYKSAMTSEAAPVSPATPATEQQEEDNEWTEVKKRKH